MIKRIEATSEHKICGQECKCFGRVFHWDRKMIGDIIENIPKLIEKDGFYKNIKITKIV